MTYRRTLALATVVILATALIGCGGSSEVIPVSAGVGSVGIQISWPERDGEMSPALVPVASESIKAEVLRNGTVVPGGTAIINRPNTRVLIDDVAAGPARLRAAAYPEPNAQGVALAVGETDISVVPGEIRGYGLVLASTIERVDIAPATPVVHEGGTLQLVATARNSSDEVILVPASGAFTWTVIAGDDCISVDENGVVRGESSGEGVVQVIEEESGVAETIVVSVMPSVL